MSALRDQLLAMAEVMADPRRVVKNHRNAYEDADGRPLWEHHVRRTPCRACLRGWARQISGELYNGPLETLITRASKELGYDHPTHALARKSHLDVIYHALAKVESGEPTDA